MCCLSGWTFKPEGTPPVNKYISKLNDTLGFIRYGLFEWFPINYSKSSVNYTIYFLIFISVINILAENSKSDGTPAVILNHEINVTSLKEVSFYVQFMVFKLLLYMYVTYYSIYDNILRPCATAPKKKLKTQISRCKPEAIFFIKT